MPHALTLARRLADLSAREIADAIGMRSRAGRAIVEALASIPSRRLGATLARFDARIAEVGIADAARETLESFGARVDVEGAFARSGPALVVTNHPGAYDALSVMAALDRDDVAFLAADRAFLRALPNVSRHLVFVEEAKGRATARAGAMRRALQWMERGGVLVQYGAGAIEPDARFDPNAPLGEWREGTGALAARCAGYAPVVPVFVQGVHSPRAKRLAVVRWVERRGTTTIAPLVQATVPGFRDVSVTVRIGAAMAAAELAAAGDHVTRTALIREAVERLRETPPRKRPRSEESERIARRSSPSPHEEASSA